MKKVYLFTFLFLSFFVFSQDAEKISIPVGSVKLFQVPFVLKEFRLLPSGTNIIKIEEMDDSQLRITAKSIGEVTLSINGIAGEKKAYAISVKSNLTTILKKIRSNLDNVPELDVSINDDQIEIKGTVTNPDHWRHFQKVLSLYEDKCVNFATFATSTDNVLDLKQRLIDAGFMFAADKNVKPGEFQISNTRDTIYITGTLYSQELITKANTIIDAAPVFSTGLVKKVVNLTLIPSIIEVSVAFVSLADTDDFSRAGNLNPTASINASYVRNWLAGKSHSKTLGFDSQMGGTISMLQTDFVAKVMDPGTITFANDSPDGGKYKFGGNIKIPVSGDNNGDLKDVSYGYDVNIKGGLISDGQVRLTLDIKSESVDNDSQGNYDQKQNNATLTVPMDLEKTYLIAHHQKTTESAGESAFPVLGRVPVVKWFFSSKAQEKKVVNVLILASASVKTTTTAPIMPINTEKVLQDANKDTQQLLKKNSVSDDVSKDLKNIMK